MTNSVGFLTQDGNYIEFNPAFIENIEPLRWEHEKFYRIVVQYRGLFYFSYETFESRKAAQIAVQLFTEACDFEDVFSN